MSKDTDFSSAQVLGSAQVTHFQQGLRGLVPTLLKMRDEKGWAPNTWDKLGIRVASLYSECVELELGIEEGGMRFACTELADICMYALVMLEDLWPGGWAIRSPAQRAARPTHRHPAVLTQPLRARIRAVYEHWRREQHRDTQIALEHVVLECIYLARDHAIDLPACVHRKITLNQARPVRHGDKNPWT